MPRCAANSRTSRTVNQVVLTASAANIVQVDCASASTKMGIRKSNSICRDSVGTDVDRLYSRDPTPGGRGIDG